MAGRYEMEVTVISARNLKNVNWKHGELLPYAALWVDPSAKCSTKVAIDGDDHEDPQWDEKLVLPLPGYDRRADLGDAVLHIDIVHANAGGDVKPLVGSARLPLSEIVDEAGIGGRANRSLKLKRPSGRPQGKLEVRVCVRETASRYQDSVPFGVPYGQTQRDPYGHPYGYAPPPPVGYAYNAPPPPGGYAYGAPPPSGYPYGGVAPPVYGQGAPSYGAAPVDTKKSQFGIGTGLAVGAAAGMLGGLALAEGVDYVEDKIANDIADRVKDDLGGYDDGGF